MAEAIYDCGRDDDISGHSIHTEDLGTMHTQVTFGQDEAVSKQCHSQTGEANPTPAVSKSNVTRVIDDASSKQH